MNPQVAEALERGGVVDISTKGRRSGLQRRIEIVFHNVDGELYITGRPGSRDWFANVLADPNFTLHLKRGLSADLAATAQPVSDGETREPLLLRIMTEGFRIDRADAEARLAQWVEAAPLIRFTVSA